MVITEQTKRLFLELRDLSSWLDPADESMTSGSVDQPYKHNELEWK